MDRPYDQEIDALMADYRRQRAGLTDLQRTLAEIAVTATAPNRAVAVTVGAQGEITELSFPTGAYRKMAPGELAAVVLATIQEARTGAVTAMAEAMQPHLPEDFSFADVYQGNLGALVPEHPPMTPEVRRLAEGDPRFTPPPNSGAPKPPGEQRWW